MSNKNATTNQPDKQIKDVIQSQSAKESQEQIESPHDAKNDKRYEEPFEDDGAYAD